MARNCTEAQRRVTLASHSNGQAAQSVTALALALCGNENRASALADDLERRLPESTLLLFNYLPGIRGQLAILKKDPSKTVALIKAASANEFAVSSTIGFVPALYTAYICGNAQLMAHDGREAMSEFQKILDHNGLVGNSPMAALAHLQIGRAYVMAGDTAKAKTAYQDFLTIWKDADPDIPILKQAKVEYAKLQ